MSEEKLSTNICETSDVCQLRMTQKNQFFLLN